MKFCIMCGCKLKEGSSFCLTCGTPVPGRGQPQPAEQPKPVEQPQPVEQAKPVEQPRHVEQPRQVEKPADSIVALSIIGLFSKLFGIVSIFILLIVIRRSFVYEGLHEVFHIGYHYEYIIGSMAAAGLALLLGIVELFTSISKKSGKINIFTVIARLAAIIFFLVFLAIMLFENINL